MFLYSLFSHWPLSFLSRFPPRVIHYLHLPIPSCPPSPSGEASLPPLPVVPPPSLSPVHQDLERIASDYMIESDFVEQAAQYGIAPGSWTCVEDRPQQEIPFEDGYFSMSEKERYEVPKPSMKIENTTPIKWQKGGLLGVGSFGKVHLGFNLDSGELIAVKQVILDGDDLANNVDLQALKQEIIVLRSLVHENIVRYLGCSVEGSTFNIFLEYVPGGSIASLIQRFGTINENIMRLYTKQILSGLEYLHSRQIIHRDIKGANILVDNKGIIKLSDFGAAKELEGLLAHTGSGFKSLKGTVYWMAPEVIRQNGYGRQADIWSLGCTVLEMATGKPPWSTEYPESVSALYNIAMRYDSPPIPSALSDDCKDFLHHCFKRNPKERPNAKGLLGHPWITHSEHHDHIVSPLPTPNHNVTHSSPFHVPSSGHLASVPSYPPYFSKSLPPHVTSTLEIDDLSPDIPGLTSSEY